MRDLIQELRQRNVFCAAAVYGVIGWVMVQLTTVIETKLLLPETTDDVVTLILYLATPLVLVAAWFFEMTPDGLQLRGKADLTNVNEEVGAPSTDYMAAGAFALFACFVVTDMVVPDRAVPLTAAEMERGDEPPAAKPIVVELPALDEPESQSVEDLPAPVETAETDGPDITADLPTGNVSVPSVIE